MNRNYQICTRCVMDTSVADISFDERGMCNYCTEFLTRFSSDLLHESPERRQKLNDFVAKVKRDGRNKPYDCIVGVSGGVDSSATLVYTVELGLRPLAAHMDNGWNSELAQNNIANLVRGLGVDLYTHVIDWNEYRGLMQAFFDADVIDVELLYDNAMLAVNYQQASKYGLHYILAGTNLSTEGMRLPESWSWFKRDRRNIEDIAHKAGVKSLKTYPAIGTFDYLWYNNVRGIKWISFLDYFVYEKSKALEMLQKDFGYKPYPYKHYESIFTRFYQGYILPKKFGVDKRRVHLSSLIVSGQMPRGEALEILEDLPYPSEMELEEDKQYFIKKMLWNMNKLDEYINRPGRKHTDFASEKLWLDRLRMLRQWQKR